MATATKHTTADELLKMPADGYRYELIKGILKQMSPTGKKHGKIAARITASLEPHVRINNLGEVFAAETGFKIASDPDTVRAPDVAFVRRERTEKIGDIEGFVPGPPDLAVEVVSPSDSYSEVEEKVHEWLAAGTRMVIVANGRIRTLTIYRSLADIKILTEEDTLTADDIVPGWGLHIKGLFE